MLQGETGNRQESFGSASGRVAIAMAAVRIGMYASVGKVTDRSNIRPRTDVMAITSLPQDPANHPVSGLPFGA
jgi:hypothetical protein